MLPTDLNRRDFAKSLAIGAVLAPVNQVGAQEPAKKDAPSVADLQLEQIKQQYPDERLDDAALKSIRGDLQQQINRSKILSAFPLTNADEPGFAFAAYRRD